MAKEKGILFSGPMVRALLNTKVGTWPAEPIDSGKPFKWQTRRLFKGRDCRWWQSCGAQLIDGMPVAEDSLGDPASIDPPYQVGDILWVRETILYDDAIPAWMYAADGIRVDGEGRLKHKPVPSMFMPRWASRIGLEVMDVRFQRLQDITEEDAKAEGVQPQTHIDVCCSHIGGFANIIDQINGPMTWRANPWVWAYSLRRIR